MAITRGANVLTAVGGSATSLAVTTPTHSPGDAILVIIKGAVAAGTVVISAPDGSWTQIAQDDNGTMSLAMFVKIAGASEPASYTFTYDASASQRVAHAIAYAGADTATPSDATGTANTGSGTALTANSVTTVTADAWLVAGVTSAGNFTFSSSDLDEVDDSNRTAAYDRAQAVAGASGNKSITLSSSSSWIALMGALRPAGAGGTDDLVADNIDTGAPDLGEPTIGQEHALDVATLSTGAPTLGTPTLGQTHALTANAISAGAPTLDAPTLGQAHALAAGGITTGAPTLDAPTLGQTHRLTSVGITTGAPALGAPTLGQIHALTAVGITTGNPTLGAPTLSEAANTDPLTATDIITGAPTLGAPLFGQSHNLAAAFIIAGAPVLGAPNLAQIHALFAVGITAGQPVLGTPGLDSNVYIQAPDPRRIRVVPVNRGVGSDEQPRVIVVRGDERNG